MVTLRKRPKKANEKASENVKDEEDQEKSSDSDETVELNGTKQSEEDEAQEEEEDNDDEEEQESDTPDGLLFNSGRRYPLRKKRAQSQVEQQLPRRSHRKRRENFGSNSSNSLHRLPPNPVLDVRKRNAHNRPRHRRRKLDHCSSSSNSGSSTSSSSDEGREGIHTLRKDLRAEQKFERRKLKSLLKGRKELMPINIAGEDVKKGSLLNMAQERARLQKRSSCADIDPMSVDNTVGFDQIGGLSRHIQQLKEMCLFPMIYPHMFEHFGIQPPKGVLFYGPPGTGKTLVARALASECSKSRDGSDNQQTQRVAFFMRKGADCLSKWVGESERQLRLLFDQAYRMRPSIIFFDEIDGLAPVRSSRQDQIHSSIVSTLLALMDGIDSRGEIIVIGATNRLDSIDPALRRPGRFDRELRFDLPDCTARQQILGIHTRNWPAQIIPSQQGLKILAEHTSGYCGADLKALCTETVLIAMRERYPHMYISKEKLLLEPSQVRIKEQHFFDALRIIVPAARRDAILLSSNNTNKGPLSTALINPLINDLLETRVPMGYQRKGNNELEVEDTQNGQREMSKELKQIVTAFRPEPAVPATRLLLHGKANSGQGTHFLPALLARLDHLPVYTISCQTVFSGGIGGPPEEQITQTLRQALRATAQGTPAVLDLPDIDLLQQTLPIATWKMFISSLNAFTGSTSVLLLAAVQCPYEEMNEDLQQAFRSRHAFMLKRPKRAALQAYFEHILKAAREQPLQLRAENYPEPPKVVHVEDKQLPVRKVSKAEYKELDLMYQQMLRQFRIFLRDLLRQLIRDPRFKCFHLPVDKEDAEDYYEIIKEPMTLSEIMHKIDAGAYQSKTAFMRDVELIKRNAIEYNPDKDMEHKQIRHASFQLLDMTKSLFEMEMDDDFPDKLDEMHQLIEEAKRSLNIVSGEGTGLLGENGDLKCNGTKSEEKKRGDRTVDFNLTNGHAELMEMSSAADETSGPCHSNSLSSAVRHSSTSNGGMKRGRPSKSYSPAKVTVSMREVLQLQQNGTDEELPSKRRKEKSNGGGESSPPPIFVLNESELSAVGEEATRRARGSDWSVPDIECLGAELEQIIGQYRDQWDRSELPQQLLRCVQEFEP